MQAAIPTELLMRLCRATPEQLAGVWGILGGGGVGGASVAAEGEGGMGGSEAARVFALMKELESGPRQRKAPVVTVFRLVVLEGLSQRVAAARCGCAESLISARVAVIEGRFGMRIERLRNYASELLNLERTVREEKRRKRRFGQPDEFEGEQEEGLGGGNGFGEQEEGEEESF